MPGQYNLSDAQATGTGKYSLTDAEPVKQEEEPGIGSRIWNSFVAALPNPVASIKEWINRPKEIGKAFDALHVLNQAHKDNRPLTADEQAIVDKGMTANIGGSKEGGLPLGTEPAAKAIDQARKGDFAGATGTLLSYPAVAAAAAAGSKIPAAASEVATFAKTPGTGQMAAGLGETAGGAGLTVKGHMLAGPGLIYQGIQTFNKGLAARRAAAAAPTVPTQVPSSMAGAADVVPLEPQFEEMPPAPTARPFMMPAEANPGLLDDIAKSMAGKPFAKLSETSKAGVRAVAARMNKPASVQLPASGQPLVAGPVVQSRPASAPGPTETFASEPLEPLPTAASAPVLPEQPIGIDTRLPVEPKQTPGDAAQALANELGQSGTIPFSRPAYVKRDQAAGKASLEPEGFKAAARDVRSTTAKQMSAHLKEKGITAETDMAKIADAIAESGIELPKTPGARIKLMSETMFELRKAQ